MIHVPIGVSLAAACALLAPVHAPAQESSPPGNGAGPAPDKSVYNLFNPTPAELMRDMSTDRPDTTESPYTVDAGHFQLELSFADFTYDRRNPDQATVRALAAAPMLIKAGLLNNVDLQLGMDPYTWVRTEDRTSGTNQTIDGFGDTVVRLKVNLWGNDGGQTAIALMPFVKLPTADDALGNGNIEGGLIAPLAVALPGEFSLGLMAEIDFVRSAADDRYVVDFAHTATLGHDLVGDLAGYLEYAGFANLNGDDDYRAYFDAGLTWGIKKNVQLDCGVRVGLTEAADDAGVFAGMSVRF